ncbi:RNA polymerase subunit sigma [Synechococcus sp. GreenBA-s]|nr:RNA polymerase subunit sigma [Synechococcus sp. GreenBA-s]
MTSAERAFACQHLGLAHRQARRFAQRWQLSTDELLGPAYEGLCKGAIGFDPSLGHRPSSYLVPKVNGELLHHLRDTGYLLRISHRLRELWIKARRPLAQGLNDEEIARQLSVPLEVWLDCRRACGQRPVPLEEVQGE